MVLTKGRIDPSRPTLVRMHALSPFSDLLGEAGNRAGLLRRSMEIIGAEGAGVIVVLTRARNDAFTTALRIKSGEASDADMEELRDYGAGATVLSELGVRDMILLTNTHHTLVGLEGYGLSIVGERAITESE
jgi:3,4-dihydroxy 2-butanone 4-phosphate synthase/GTP cyclohydrolase II